MRPRFLATAVALIALAISGGRLSAQGTTSVCKDGTTSATSGKGACSGHGGVDAKATAAASKKGARPAPTAAKTTAATAAKSAPATVDPAAASKTAPAAKSAPATKTASASEKDPKDAVAKCKDGTYSHQATHQGACSRHGGVEKFLK